jgi:hypothetical protein
MDLIPRHVTPTVREAIGDSRVVALIGPRQVGKTTLARALIEDGWKAEYASLDDDQALRSALEDPGGFVHDFRGPVVIDEIQRAPGLMLAIKQRVDEDPTPGRFLITGSANLTALGTVQDALPGRVDYIRLMALSQSELARVPRPRFLERLRGGKVPRLGGAPMGFRANADRIMNGGYPGAVARSGASRLRFFRNYARSLLDRDLPSIAEVRRPELPLVLLNLIAARSAAILNISSLARDVKADENTVRSHLKLLEDLMLVQRIWPWYRNLGQRQIKAPKVLITDPGLLAGLLGVNADGVAADPIVKGSVFETMVVTELMKLATSTAEPPDLYHYRDSKQREIDLVLEWPDGSIVAIEAKAGSTVNDEDLRSLRYLRDKVGGSFKAGVVVNCGDRVVPFGDRIHAVPVSALWSSGAVG